MGVSWQPHPSARGALRLEGLYGLEVVLAPLPGVSVWSATVTVVEADHVYTRFRDSRQEAQDWALARALALYPAVVDLARRRAAEGDPDDMTECRRSEQDLLMFALRRP